MKTLTVRMSDEDYQAILKGAKKDKRTLSNFMLSTTLRAMERSYYTQQTETNEIMKDRLLMEGIEKGHKDVLKKRGKYV